MSEGRFPPHVNPADWPESPLRPEPRQPGPNGGVRKGAGRPKGTPNKITASGLLAEIEKRDVPFAEGLAEDYIAARRSGNRGLTLKYQQLILSKVLADKVDVSVTDQNRIIEAKREAFRSALESMNIIDITPRDPDTTALDYDNPLEPDDEE